MVFFFLFCIQTRGAGRTLSWWNTPKNISVIVGTVCMRYAAHSRESVAVCMWVQYEHVPKSDCLRDVYSQYLNG